VYTVWNDLLDLEAWKPGYQAGCFALFFAAYVNRQLSVGNKIQ